jgi:hypothetical protein
MSYGTNAPFGMQPRQHLNGSVWNGQVNTYQIQDAYGTSLFTGDPVTLSGGYLVIGVAGSATIGSFQGCLYTTAGSVITFAPYWPASTSTLGTVGATAFVCDDQTVLYDMQINASTIVQADIGKNANFVANAGSTISGQSGYAIDNTTVATGNATRNLKIMGIVPRPGNDFGVTYNNAYVMINNNVFNSGTGTVGV